MPHPTPTETGWIEVICGPMFSGKTEELLRRLKLAQFAKHRTLLFKPEMDTRYHQSKVVSHNRTEHEAICIQRPEEILALAHRVDVVGIDEGQFLEGNLVKVCQRLADEGKRVIVSGLDQDYLGKPFEPIPTLMAVAEYVTKSLAICMQCGNPADRSQRLVQKASRVVLGDASAYEARCRKCHDPTLSQTHDQNTFFPEDALADSTNEPKP